MDSPETLKPYLSIVAVARNDNHGGDLLRRLQIFVNGIFANAARAKLTTELILVDWNPPVENVSLFKAIQWPQRCPWCSVRIITVPRELHARYEHSAGLPLYQMIGKNVGIRRARGTYVLATNVDILFAPELFDFLARKTLQPGTMYRADRYDIDRAIPLDATLAQQIAYCETHIIRVSHKLGIINLESGDYQAIYAAENELNQTPEGLPMLHTNACGDFQLMSIDDWLRIRGYAELDMYSFHIDSLLAYTAHYSGIQERYLKDPYRVYHIDHSSGFTPETMKSLDGHLSKKKVPRLTDEELWNEARAMMASATPTIFNQDDWGLQKYELH